MIESLISLSTWVEDNSGQIQIIIALVALVLAYKAYQKVLVQLKAARIQEEEAYQQRGLELKIQSMNLSLLALEHNNKTTSNLEDVKRLSRLALESSSEDECVKPKELKDLIRTIETKIKESEESTEEILNMINVINSREILEDPSILQSLYDLLVLNLKDKALTELMKYHFVEKK